MLIPKKVKYRRWQRDRSNPKKIHKATRGIKVSFGAYGMRAITPARLKSNQIEAARRVISRAIGKTGRIWIRVFTDRPWTQKAAEVGMGKGKGDLQGYEVEVLPGRLIFEVGNVEEAVAKDAIIRAGKKLPLKIKVAIKE